MRRLFRVELHAEDALMLYGGGEGPAVVGSGDLVGRIHGGVGVDEVEDLALDPFEERPMRSDSIPADLRDGQGPIELPHVAAHEAEPPRAAHLLRGVEEELM